MPLNGSEKPVQFNVTCAFPAVGVTVPFTGAVVSRIIVSKYGVAFTLPHLSLGQLTVLLSLSRYHKLMSSFLS